MGRGASIRGWASRDPGVRWGAGAAVALVWTAVAWADPAILLGLPLVATALAVLYVCRRGDVQAGDDEDDWL